MSTIENKTETNASRSNLRSKFQKGVIFTGGATSINIIALFIEIMVATRFLETQSYGIYVLMVAIVNFFVMIVDFGFKTSAAQMIASSDEAKQSILVNTILIFRLIVNLGIFIVLLLIQNWLSVVDSSRSLEQYAIFIPIMLVGISFDELLAGILQGFHRFKHIAVATIIRSVLRLIISIILLTIFKFGIMALIYSWVISFLISAGYQYFQIPISKKLIFSRPVLKEIFKFGIPLHVSRFIWFMSGRLSIFLLGILAIPSSVAFYDVAEKLPKALQSLSASFITVFFPSMTSLLSDGKLKQAKWMFDQSVRLISFVLALLALVTVLFGQEIITLMFSEKYIKSSLVFAILMISFQMGFIVNLMGYTLTSAGYPGRSLVENIFRIAMIIVGNIVLIKSFGIMGAALALLIANYLSNPLSVWLLRRSDIPVNVSTYVKPTFLLLLFSGLFWLYQPAEFVIKALIVLMFVGINFAIATISLNDFALVLPRALTRRLRIQPIG